MSTKNLPNPDYLGNDDYFSSPPRNNNNDQSSVTPKNNNNNNFSQHNNSNSFIAGRQFNMSSSSFKATRNKILDTKRLRLFSGDETIFVVRTNNNGSENEQKSKKKKKKNQKEENENTDEQQQQSSSDDEVSSDENEELNENNRTLMMLLMIQQQETNNAAMLNFSSPSGHNNNNVNMMSMMPSPAVQQMHPQSVWHVSNIVNLHLPGLLWSDPESTGKWQRWLLRAIPEMVNLVRLDVRDGQMGDLWCRALMDALIEQKVNAGVKKSSMIQSASVFSPRQKSATNNINTNNNPNQADATPSIFVLHMENNFITQQSIQYIGRLFSAVASQLQEIKTTSSTGGAGFFVELYLTGNNKIGDHGAQVLAAHALKGASVHEVSNRVILRFLDICGCEVGGRGVSDLLSNCGTFCNAIICEGWKHQFTSNSVAHQHFNNLHQNQISPASSIYSRDSMRNIPAVTSLRVVDLSGSGHRMSSTAFNVLLPALLLCCPRLRAIGFGQVIRSPSQQNQNQQQSFTTSSQLVRSLIDSLTSLCRSCQRAPALEFIDMSGCHISDQSILKLIEFITREKAREQAGLMLLSQNNNKKKNNQSLLAASAFYLRLRILDVSNGEILPDEDRSKAPITIGGDRKNNSKLLDEPTQLHVRSSLGKETWRAIMLACAMEDDETLQIITDGVRKDRSRKQQQNNNNNSNNNDDDDEEKMNQVREYIQAVTASPSSRYTKSLLRRSRSSRLALEHGESEEDKKRRIQEQLQRDEELRREKAENDAKEQAEAAKIAAAKKALEDAEAALRQKERELQEQEEKMKLKREKEEKEEAARMQKLKQEQERQQEMERLQQQLREKEALLEQQKRKEEQDDEERKRQRAEKERQELQQQEAERKRLLAIQQQQQQQQAEAEEAERKRRQEQQQEQQQQNNNTDLPPPSLDASPIDMVNKTQMIDEQQDNSHVDRALDFTNKANENENENDNKNDVREVNNDDDDDDDSADEISSVISDATSLLDRTSHQYLLSQANRSYTITVAHDPEQHPLLCCIVPLIAGGVPTTALFTQLLLADLQSYTNTNHNDKNGNSDQTNIVIEKIQSFLDGAFVVNAKTSARRHMVDHVIKAAFAAPVTEAFPRSLAVVNSIMDRTNRVSSSQKVAIVIPPNGEVVDCPRIERCQRHKNIPFEIPASLPFLNKSKKNSDNKKQSTANHDDDHAEAEKEDQRRAAELKLRHEEEEKLRKQQEEEEAKKKKKEQEEKEKAAAIAANPVLSVKQRIQEKLEAEKKKRQEAAAAAAAVNEKKEDDLSKTVTPHNEVAEKKNGNDDSEVDSKQNDDKKKPAENDAASPPPPPPVAPPPPPPKTQNHHHHINVFNFEDYAKKAQQKSKDRAAKVAAQSATATKASSLFLRAAAASENATADGAAIATSNGSKNSTDIFSAPSSPSSSSPSPQEPVVSIPILPVDTQRTLIRTYFGICLKSLKQKHPVLDDDDDGSKHREFGARNKKRVLKGWIVERANETSESAAERGPDEAPRYAKQQVVVNVEWEHFLVIKTCNSEMFEVSRSLYFMHPLLGNALYPSSSLSEADNNSNTNNNNNNTSVVNNTNTVTPYELRRVEPLCRPGGNDSIVLFFVTPRGNVHAMNFTIDPDGFGDDWEEEKKNNNNSKNNMVMKVLNRLNYAVAKSSVKVLAAE